MKSYRFNVHYAGQHITADVKAHNDDEAKVNFINELKEGRGMWRKESFYTPSKVFISYEELNGS